MLHAAQVFIILTLCANAASVFFLLFFRRCVLAILASLGRVDLLYI